MVVAFVYGWAGHSKFVLSLSEDCISHCSLSMVLKLFMPFRKPIVALGTEFAHNVSRRFSAAV